MSSIFTRELCELREFSNRDSRLNPVHVFIGLEGPEMNKITYLCVVAFVTTQISVSNIWAFDVNISKEEFAQIINQVAGNKTVRIEGGIARLFDEDGEWSIFGANQR